MDIRNKMRGTQTTMLDPAILVPAIGQSFVKLDPRVDDQEPGDVRGRGRRHAHHRDLPPRSGHRRRLARLHLPDHLLAVVHRGVRQLRRGGGGRPRQGAGGDAAQGAHRDAWPSASSRCTATEYDDRRRAVAATGRHRPGRGRRPHPQRRRGGRRHRLGGRSRRSPANPRRSSAKAAATVRRSPAAPACCRTGSRCASPRRRARPSSTA